LTPTALTDPFSTEYINILLTKIGVAALEADFDMAVEVLLEPAAPLSQRARVVRANILHGLEICTGH
jgi:hypothetical protein